jgi:thiaminase/transcriptional activator TenA
VENAPLWRSLHEHPFIVGLCEGSLPLDRFRFFLEQDNLYLEEYARCLATGAAKSRSERELRYFAEALSKVLDAELPNNRALLERVIDLGAEDRGGSVAKAPANVAYTSFLHTVAMRGGALEILASLLPCVWSYVDIAVSHEAAIDVAHPVYRDWIGYFALPESVGVVADMRRDFDAMVGNGAMPDERRAELAQIFTTSLRMEWAFWEMAYTLERWPDAVEG